METLPLHEDANLILRPRKLGREEFPLVGTRFTGLFGQTHLEFTPSLMMRNLETAGRAYCWSRTAPSAFEAFLERVGPQVPATES
jgi:hypothetical protein